MTVNPVARGFVVIHGDLRQRLKNLVWIFYFRPP